MNLPNSASPFTTANSKRAHLDGIDALRAYAALSIVVFHVIWLTGLNPPHYFDFCKQFLGYGVPLFYLISSFSMTYGYAHKLENKLEVRNFYLRRVARITPLFYFFLVVTLVEHALNGNYHRLTEIALNLTYGFNLTTNWVSGIVPASWSIGNEMLFYAVFPLLMVFVDRIWVAFVSLALWILIAVTFTKNLSGIEALSGFSHTSFISNFHYFMWGIFFYFIFKRWHKPLQPHARLLTTIGCLAMLGLYALSHDPINLVAYFDERKLRSLYDTFWCIPFGLITLGAALDRIRLLTNRVSIFLGKISFSLYLGHPHVISALKLSGAYDLLDPVFAKDSGPYLLAATLITCSVLIPLSYITYRFIEVPGMAYGKRLLARPQ